MHSLDYPSSVILVVNSVSWKPFYELHAKTEKELPSSSVSLQYRARVKQSTGEDWTQTALTLSTVTSDSSNTAIPEPRPLKLVRTGSRLVNESRNGPTQKPAQRERVRARSAINSHALAHYSATSPRYSPASPQYSPTRSSYSSDTSAAVPCAVVESSYGFRGTNPSAPPPVIMVPATIVSETPVAASYSVEGKSTIPSDAKGHQVSIANLPFDAQISHITVPRIEPRVYLEVSPYCRCRAPQGARLLNPMTVRGQKYERVSTISGPCKRHPQRQLRFQIVHQCKHTHTPRLAKHATFTNLHHAEHQRRGLVQLYPGLGLLRQGHIHTVFAHREHRRQRLRRGAHDDDAHHTDHCV